MSTVLTGTRVIGFLSPALLPTREWQARLLAALPAGHGAVTFRKPEKYSVDAPCRRLYRYEAHIDPA